MPECIDWEKMMMRLARAHAEVLDCIDQGRLRYRGKQFSLPSIDRVSVMLVRVLCARGGHLVIHYPVPQFKALSILALEAMYNRPDSGERPNVLCITRDPWHRDEYMNLAYASFSTPIYKMSLPIGMLRAGGGIRELGVGHQEYLSHLPHLVFCPTPHLPEQLGQRTSALIVEVDSRITPDDIKYLDGWARRGGVPAVLYIIADPISPQARQLRSLNIPVWSWDMRLPATKKAVGDGHSGQIPTPFSPPERLLEVMRLGQEYIIKPVEDPDLMRRLNEAALSCAELSRAAGRIKTESIQDASRRAWATLHALEELPVPASYYDKEAETINKTVTISRRLAWLDQLVSEVQRETPHEAGLLCGTANKLRFAQEAMLNSHSGKPLALLGSIRLAAEGNHPLGVVVRNTAAKNALEKYLAAMGRDVKKLEEAGVNIMTAGELEDGDFIGPLLFSSVPNIYHRSTVLYPGSNKLAFLAYPSEMPIVQHLLDVDMPEARRWSTLDNMLEVVISTTGAKRKDMVKLIGKQPHLEPIKSKVVYTSPQKATAVQVDLQPIFSSIIGSEEEEEGRREPEGLAGEEHADGATGPVSVVAIGLEDGDTLIVRATGSITTYNIGSGAIDDTQARFVKEGDFVILVDETTTRSLLEVILERVHKHPKMMFHVINQRAWISGLRKGMERSGDDPDTLLRKLREQGSTITHPVTIRNWRKGIVIGPLDRDDIARLGRVYSNEFLIKNAKDIYLSVERVREIHRRLARKLRYLIKRAGVSYETLKDDELIVDAELGLYLEDFSDSVRVDEVRSISQPFTADSRKIGKLFKGDSWRS